MKQRMLHDLTVSAVGMGCMAFSHGYGQIPQLSRRNIAGNQPIVDVLKDFAARTCATPAQISLA